MLSLHFVGSIYFFFQLELKYFLWQCNFITERRYMYLWNPSFQNVFPTKLISKIRCNRLIVIHFMIIECVSSYFQGESPLWYKCVLQSDLYPRCLTVSSEICVSDSNIRENCVAGGLFYNRIASRGHPQQPHESRTGASGKTSLPTVWSARVCVSEILGAL